MAALVSTVLAATLAVGYLGLFGLLFVRSSASGIPAYWEIEPRIDRGRFICYVTRGATWGIGQVPTSATHVLFRGKLDPTPFDVRRAVWVADAHLLSSTPTSRTYLFAAPIWCFELPLLIAPALWLRHRRRQRADPVGFAIVTSDAG